MDISLSLLERTQAYLHALARGTAPSSESCAAWKSFYAFYRPLVSRVIQAFRLRGADAEDCAQEVWIVIVRALVDFEFDPRRGRLAGWITQLTRNRVIDFLRSRQAGPGSLETSSSQIPCHRGGDPAQLYERERTRARMRQALRQLQEQVSATNYGVIHFRWLEGQEVSQVAARLDLTREQVWYRHCRMKERLRTLLSSEV